VILHKLDKDKSSLRNISENENISVLIKMQTERSGQSKIGILIQTTATSFRTQIV